MLPQPSRAVAQSNPHDWATQTPFIALEHNCRIPSAAKAPGLRTIGFWLDRSLHQ
jgi:hypothetical protein